MADAIAFIVALLVAGGGLLALMNWLANIDRRRAAMSEEEYEEHRKRSPGVLGAGMMAIDQQIFRRSAERAVEYRVDAEQGRLPGGGQAEGDTNLESDDR
jgi:hypothetical protein